MLRVVATSLLLSSLSFVVATQAACMSEDPVDAGDHATCEESWAERALPPLAERSGTAVSGDLSCSAATDAPARWLTVDAACIERAQLTGKAIDPHLGYAFGGVVYEFFFSDVDNGLAEVIRTSNEDGTLSNVFVPTCAPFTYVATGDRDTALPTTRQHIAVPFEETWAGDLTFFSGAAVATLASLLGESLIAGRGALFGRVVGCDGAPIVGAHVVVRDGACRAIDDEGGATGYTRFGAFAVVDPALRATSDDGGFFAVNVPEGGYVVEAFVTDGEVTRPIGRAPVAIAGDEVALVDVQVGRADGVALPAACARCD